MVFWLCLQTNKKNCRAPEVLGDERMNCKGTLDERMDRGGCKVLC